MFVHCAEGVSRSASIVLAYVIYFKDLYYEEAYKLVHDVREKICPNPSFESSVREFGKKFKVYGKEHCFDT